MIMCYRILFWDRHEDYMYENIETKYGEIYG